MSKRLMTNDHNDSIDEYNLTEISLHLNDRARYLKRRITPFAADGAQKCIVFCPNCHAEARKKKYKLQFCK